MMPDIPIQTALRDGDHAALRNACADGAGLCTIVNIEGSFSRRLGAQLAVREDGSVIGSLADGCLERQLANEVMAARAEGRPVLRRFGAGSDVIDFRLPCGSGIDILVDPSPDRAACRTALTRLDARKEVSLALPLPNGSEGMLSERRYIPALRLQLFGEGPELVALAALAAGAGFACETHRRDDPGMALGRAPEGLVADGWTAVVLLFHDHEWEAAILEWALAGPAFYIGAQGGRPAREDRLAMLDARGVHSEALARLRSPIGLVPHCREPSTLAISILAEIAGTYDALVPGS
jgi:xanthine dehydrogenase accessory factor